MKYYKRKLYINLFFVGLGILLVYLVARSGIHSGRDWFSLVAGSVVALISIVDIVRLQVEKYKHKRENEGTG